MLDTIYNLRQIIIFFLLFTGLSLPIHQSAGADGSTYRLYYFAKKDALVGFYYQAVIDKTFEVIFLRKVR
jgi:hypothetical protein